MRRRFGSPAARQQSFGSAKVFGEKMGMCFFFCCCWGCVNEGLKSFTKIYTLVFSDWKRYNYLIHYYFKSQTLWRFPNPISQQTVLLQFVECGLIITYQIKCVFAAKISGFFSPQKRINLGLSKTPVTEVSLASLWWTTSCATRWWGLEAWLGTQRVFHVPKKTGGGGLYCNHWWWWWIMRIFSGVFP